MKSFKFSFSVLFITYILAYINIGTLGGTLKWLGIIIIAVNLFLSVRNYIPKTLIPTIKFWLFLLFFDICGLITSINSDELNSSLVTLIGMNLYFFIFYIASYHLSTKEQNLILMNNLLIVISLALVIVAFLMNPGLTISQFHTYYFERIRVYGSFIYPNYLGAICFVNLIACFINMKFSKLKKKKVKYIVAFVFFLTFLLLSDSRGGLYSFLIFIFVYYFIASAMKIKNRLLRYSIGSFVFSVCVIALCLLLTFAMATLSDTTILNKFTSGRTDNWDYILNNFVRVDNYTYLFGHGLSSVDQLQRLGINTDNGYLVWIYQAGLISLILISCMLLNILRVNIRNKKFIYGLPIFLSFIIYAFFENFLLSFGHIVPFYCWTLLFISFHQQSSKSQKNRIKRQVIFKSPS